MFLDLMNSVENRGREHIWHFLSIRRLLPRIAQSRLHFHVRFSFRRRFWLFCSWPSRTQSWWFWVAWFLCRLHTEKVRHLRHAIFRSPPNIMVVVAGVPRDVPRRSAPRSPAYVLVWNLTRRRSGVGDLTSRVILWSTWHLFFGCWTHWRQLVLMV